MRATILVILSMLITACFHKTTGPEDHINGHYSAYDTADHLILQGILNLTVSEDSTITGDWVINWVSGADTTLQVGPQVGSGELGGEILDGWLYLDLNRDWADNNVILRGVWSETEIDGVWRWVTFAGPTTYGSFHLEISASK